MSTHPVPAAEHEVHGADDLHVHVMPIRILVTAFAILMGLTFLTVAVTWFDLGAANLLIALLVAVAKAGVVALYFMHLRYDKPFLGVVLITALLMVALFISIALMDTTAYQPDVQ
jgi:cytochrome c oxidase subunit 4